MDKQPSTNVVITNYRKGVVDAISAGGMPIIIIQMVLADILRDVNIQLEAALRAELQVKE